MNTLVLINPLARGGEVGRSWGALEPKLREALGGSAFETAFTSAEDHGRGRVRASLRSGTERVLVVGGDGTLTEALQGFFEKGHAVREDAVLAVFPAGRGDDFFKSLTGKRELRKESIERDALELLKTGSAQPTDVGLVRFLPSGETHYWINVASFGFPGLVVQRVMERAGWVGKTRLGRGPATYVTQSIAALTQYSPVEMDITADGVGVYRGPVFSAFALNGWYNAGGVRWSSSARLDDGKLQLLVQPPGSPLETLRTLPAMASGEWSRVPGAVVVDAARITVHVLGPLSHPLAEIDGDLPGPSGTTGLEFQALSGLIRVWR